MANETGKYIILFNKNFRSIHPLDWLFAKNSIKITISLILFITTSNWQMKFNFQECNMTNPEKNKHICKTSFGSKECTQIHKTTPKIHCKDHLISIYLCMRSLQQNENNESVWFSQPLILYIRYLSAAPMQPLMYKFIGCFTIINHSK